MRVLFAVAGGPSHLFPLVPLAWAFRVAGHEVRLAGTARSTETMAHTGLSIVTVGSGVRLSPEARTELLETAFGQPPWPADWPAHPLSPEQERTLTVLGRYTVAVSDAMASDLVAFTRQWQPDLIIHDTLALGAMVAASLTDVPCVRYTHGTQDVFRVEQRALPEYTRLFARFGLEVPMMSPCYVDTMPPSMFIGAEQPATQMRYIPHNGPGSAPAGLTGPRKRPRVCVTWGFVSGALGPNAADPYSQAIRAIVTAGAEVIVLVAADQISSLGTPPPGVRYVAEAPLNLVLPYCDALVHHGGEGSGMTAAALAVPQLVITREPLDDQFGGRLAQTGAAIHLRSYHETGPAIDKLLTDDSHTEAAARLREDIEAQPTPVDVVPRLLG